jgi:DNA-binding response OmpR family regulator
VAAPTQSVAIVEDDVGMNAALERVLRLAGFKVEAYFSAEEYLASGSAGRTDCLVCDIGLPGISGFELCRCLTHAGPAGPVIFITANDSSEARDQARRCGAAAYLPKPFEGRALVGFVRQATRSP